MGSREGLGHGWIANGPVRMGLGKGVMMMMDFYESMTV